MTAFKTMLLNVWTTVFGILAGAGYYVNDRGLTIPTTKAELKSFLVALLIGGLGVVAKSATVGSKPPSAQ